MAATDTAIDDRVERRCSLCTVWHITERFSSWQQFVIIDRFFQNTESVFHYISTVNRFCVIFKRRPSVVEIKVEKRMTEKDKEKMKGKLRTHEVFFMSITPVHRLSPQYA